MIITYTELTVYCLSSIAANTCFYMTGFGNAIIFLIIYQIADFASLMSDLTLKYGLLLQSLNLALTLPVYIVTTVKLKENFLPKLMVPMVLSDCGMLYVGQMVQKRLETKMIRLVIGGLVLVGFGGIGVYRHSFFSNYNIKQLFYQILINSNSCIKKYF